MMKRAALALMSMAAAAALAAVPPRRSAASSDSAVACEMRNVVLHLGDGVALSIRALRGALIPTMKAARRSSTTTTPSCSGSTAARWR
jgi:hypothetical protein